MLCRRSSNPRFPNARTSHDTLFCGEKRRDHAPLTAVNVGTFSGTHFVGPLAITAQVGVGW